MAHNEIEIIKQDEPQALVRRRWRYFLQERFRLVLVEYAEERRTSARARKWTPTAQYSAYAGRHQKQDFTVASVPLAPAAEVLGALQSQLKIARSLHWSEEPTDAQLLAAGQPPHEALPPPRYITDQGLRDIRQAAERAYTHIDDEVTLPVLPLLALLAHYDELRQAT